MHRVSVAQSDAPSGTFVQIVTRGNSNCALGSNGKVTCWGVETHWEGRLYPPDACFQRVSLGGGHACAIRPDDTVDCWGWDRYGQAVDPDGTFTRVTAGDAHTCGRRTDGGVGRCRGMG